LEADFERRAPLPQHARTELAIEIVARTFDKDSTGCEQATFYNSVNKQSDRLGVYLLASDHFTCLQGDDEDDEVFERRLLVWLLEQCTTLEEAAWQDAPSKLFGKIKASGPFAVRAATSNGWFDLQLDRNAFGPFPRTTNYYSQASRPCRTIPFKTWLEGSLMFPGYAWSRSSQRR